MIKLEKWDVDFNIYHVDSIESTNTYLKENYNSFLDNSVLVADKQTKGRGRYNRVWISDDDIIFSLLFKKNDFYEIITPLAIVIALKKYGLEAKIKWPNDIYLNNKKLCGILIEDIYSSKFESAIIGVGINYKNKPEIDGIGLNLDIPRKDIITSILNTFNEIKNYDYDYLSRLYKEYNMVIGKTVRYKNKTYLAVDITYECLLVLVNENEKIIVRSDEINIKEAMN